MYFHQHKAPFMDIYCGAITILEPAKYEWIIENGLLVPTKKFAIPSDLTTKCPCKNGIVRM